MAKYPISEHISQFSQIFNENGFSLYIVGGAVRDYLLGIENSDYDFCTDARPEQVMELFHKVIPTGIKHGTVTVLFKGESYEVTTFRTEGAYSDSRHPDSVTFVTDLELDLSRRDFTVNAFAADCRDGHIIDLFDGISDLHNGTIRAIGNPFERFTEDALRMMRMARFCSKLGFSVEPNTFEAAKVLSRNIVAVSNERICDELTKTLSSKCPTVGLTLLEESGLMDCILPELVYCRLTEQQKDGCSNVLEHLYKAVEAAASLGYGLVVRMACLLHDIAKPYCKKELSDTVIAFYGHEIRSAEMAREILRKLKCSNQFIDQVSVLIENHMIQYSPTWTDGAVKRFIKRVGKDNINNLFELQWCDQIASEGYAKVHEYDPFIERIKAVENQPMTVKDLAINGQDLSMAGIPKSRLMGQILESLLEMVIDDPELNKKETLLSKALEIFKQK